MCLCTNINIYKYIHNVYMCIDMNTNGHICIYIYVYIDIMWVRFISKWVYIHIEKDRDVFMYAHMPALLSTITRQWFDLRLLIAPCLVLIHAIGHR